MKRPASPLRALPAPLALLPRSSRSSALPVKKIYFRLAPEPPVSSFSLRSHFYGGASRTDSAYSGSKHREPLSREEHTGWKFHPGLEQPEKETGVSWSAVVLMDAARTWESDWSIKHSWLPGIDEPSNLLSLSLRHCLFYFVFLCSLRLPL